MAIDPRLASVFSSVFGVDEARLSEGDSAETIPAWDSVSHLNLIIALEAEYGIQFEPGEIADLVDVGVIQRRLTRPRTDG